MLNYNMSAQNIPNLHVYSMVKRESKRGDIKTCSVDNIESKSIHKMDISEDTSKVKDTKNEESPVTDISLIKETEYFKLLNCSKQVFNNLDVAYEHMCMANAKNYYWTYMYDTITNYNNCNYTPLSNANIIEAINKVLLETKAEENNSIDDTISQMRNEGDNIINKVEN